MKVVRWKCIKLLGRTVNTNLLFVVADNRSSHQRCSIKKGVLRNFANFTGKNLCQSLFFNKGFNKKETLAQVFSCEFCEISETTFSTEHLWKTNNFKISFTLLTSQLAMLFPLTSASQSFEIHYLEIDFIARLSNQYNSTITKLNNS